MNYLIVVTTILFIAGSINWIFNSRHFFTGPKRSVQVFSDHLGQDISKHTNPLVDGKKTYNLLNVNISRPSKHSLDEPFLKPNI